MLVYSLKSDLVRPGDSVVKLFTDALAKNRVRLNNDDVVAVSSKIVAISQRRIRNLESIIPTRRAKEFARKFSLSPEFAQTVLDESDRVIGGVKGALLTIRNGDTVANAGVDRKNAPKGTVVLWPAKPDMAARRLRTQIKSELGRNVGVVLVDSRVAPLRLGTVGFAIGAAGFQAVDDLRGFGDLSDRKVEITRHATADDIAATAHLVMGEVAERTPFAVVRDAPINFKIDSGMSRAKVAPDECLYVSNMR